MSSIIGICNKALGRIGDISITSLNDTTRAAVLCNLFYDASRKELLSLAEWVFATKLQKNISPTTTTPDFKYSYQFAFPTDLVTLMGLWEATSEYTVSGRYILTNDSSINVVYVSNVEDPNDFSPMFESSLVLRLAYYVSYALAPSADLTKLLLQAYGLEFAEARRVDAKGHDWSLKKPLPEIGEKPTWSQVRRS